METILKYSFKRSNSLKAAAIALVLGMVLPVQGAIQPMKLKPLGKLNAPIGGTLYRYLNSEPEKINPISSTDYVATQVQEYVMDGLLNLNIDTFEFQPGLAESYEILNGGMQFVFHLRKDAKFSDGKPVTAEDVKFSFDSVKDPAFNAAHRIPYYENLESVEIVDPSTIRLKMKKKFYSALEVYSTWGYTPIVPKHIYGDPKKKTNKDLVGSGPYKVEQYLKGKSITLVRNPEWWGFKTDLYKSSNKFERIVFRFVTEQNLRIELAKKGQIDYLDDMNPEMYVKKAVGAPWGTEVIKKQVQNLKPKDYSFIAWNLKNPIFKDRNVRLALTHLTNREMMIEKFRYGLSIPATGPWYPQNPNANKDVKPIPFDPEKARNLLKAAGWEDKDKNGVLEKEVEGKPTEFRFTILLANRDFEKYLTIMKEDMKKVGVDMVIKIVEWNAFVKALDEKKFDAVTLRWAGGSVEYDPKQIWHSSSARDAGSNFISYNNQEVDKLIDQAQEEMSKEKRSVIWKKVYKLIADDVPYTFLFVNKYELYALNKRIAQEKDTYSFDYGYQYWWVAP